MGGCFFIIIRIQGEKKGFFPKKYIKSWLKGL